MASDAPRTTTPRYASVAEVARHLGLSPKTIRRLIAAGALHRLKIGRRVLIPFEDLDQLVRHAEDRPRTQEAPVMASAPTTDPTATVDPATGRLRPLSEEQRKARSEALARALAELAEITDATDTEETWQEVFRGIDATRPHRPLFEGQY